MKQRDSDMKRLCRDQENHMDGEDIIGLQKSYNKTRAQAGTKTSITQLKRQMQRLL